MSSLFCTPEKSKNSKIKVVLTASFITAAMSLISYETLCNQASYHDIMEEKKHQVPETVNSFVVSNDR